MRYRGPWSNDEIERFLQRTAIPLRVACNGSQGHPLMASLWFAPVDGQLWCASQRSSSVVSRMAADPRCAFEVSVEAPPYVGVRGRAVASLHPYRGEQILRLLIARYLGKSSPTLASSLLARVESETAICIEPVNFTSWDFRERMRESA